MAHWMDRSTEGFTQMGGEGTNWIGEAPFSKTPHVFQNLGDGTYIHSGSLAIRAARAAGVNMTFKILYNDAVAMTGGQSLDGGMTVPMIVDQVLAEGIEKVVVVTDEPHKYPSAPFPQGVPVHHRRELQSRAEASCARCRASPCSSTTRPARPRSAAAASAACSPIPTSACSSIPAVCEGCGDCGVKSNCVAVSAARDRARHQARHRPVGLQQGLLLPQRLLPELRHGARRQGEEGAGSRSATAASPACWRACPSPSCRASTAPYTMLVTGVGGTGVVTLSAVLGQAAHLEGKGFGSIDMTGLAQKGGAVACHMRVANDADADPRHPRRRGRRRPGARLRSRGDRLQQGARDHQARPHRGGLLQLRDGDRPTSRATPTSRFPARALRHAIEERAGKAPVHAFDAHTTAVKLFGDSIAANMFMLGYAYQLGHVPIGSAAIEQAIELNGAAVEMSRNAFRFGRLAAREPGARCPADRRRHHARCRSRRRWRTSSPSAPTSSPSTRMRRWPSAIASRVAQMAEIERKQAPGRSGLAEAVARSYYKLLAYKDEYEVARLYAEPGLREGAGRAVRVPPQVGVPSGAAAAGAPRQGHRRAAQDALRRLDAARVPPAGEGQATARHGAGTCSDTRPSASSSGR